MYKKKLIYFRIDLSEKHGLGHYFRIKSLANYLGIKKYIIVVDKLPSSDFFKFNDKNIISLYENNSNYSNENEDAKKFLKVVNKKSKDLVVIKDSYRLSFEWEKKVSKFCKKIISIEDTINRKHYVDFYINHSPSFIKKNHNDLNILKYYNKKNCKFLLGTDFSLFNSKFNSDIKILSDFTFYNGGSGDPLVYKKIINRLAKLKKKYKITIIVGPLVNKNKYKKLVKNFKNFKNVKIVHQPFGILNILRHSQLFISSAGVSIFESSFLRVPTLLFKMVPNQNLVDEDYEKLGHYFILEKKDLKNTNKVFNLLQLMFENKRDLKLLMKDNCINLSRIKKNYKKLIKF